MSRKNMKKNNRNVNALLATAALTLISNTTHADEEQKIELNEKPAVVESDWKFDAALLYYSESDSRVTAIEPIIQATRIFSEDETLSFRLTVDTLTGASPSGAVASNQPQTFTSPSGNANYEIAANTYPLDNTFLDTRVALATNWSFALSNKDQITLGANVSSEYDYQSLSFNGNISHDFNSNNSTLFAGLSYTLDSIDPVGGSPTSLSRMQPVGETQSKVDGSQDKDILDLLIGITQVVDKYSLFQINYSYSSSDGYHSDPYKVLSVLGDDGNYFDDGITTANVLFENRPDKRTKHSIYGRYKRYFDGNILDLSYRYMTDDWEIDSHTVDLKYRFDLSNNNYIQPHIRYYSQTEAFTSISVTS